ncbi:endonuclease/exonuclease/phosphatase family protein [Micromonospora sp. WMMD1128]|uniref:endonuclease/exonuclease/phosphatase family protein n=1 Tax=Micromonospora sp. WMMD1128 TaxID=3015150 RepID=UPI00248C72F1|nr:endonuclease/exonuclease/phosphatase family protein [Micromonospora sp. WMMD1128]WBB75968.1 endonuclease/exonuclease/phosphatase family protein [Micromonospora sp. WMMD1128]
MPAGAPQPATRAPRRIRRAFAVVCLLVVAGLPAGSSTAGATGPGTLRVLQMNLCNSGRAGCWTGRAVSRAGEVIAAERPDVVTLNEICRDDVGALERSLAAVHRGGTVVSAFQAAGDRPSGAATRCHNGQPYGIGVLVRLDTGGARPVVRRGTYPTQDRADPEERVWLCVGSAGLLHACTTHLANTSGAVALAQCGHLLDAVVPAVRHDAGPAPTVLGGDLNLRAGGEPDVRACVPPDYRRIDDGARQHLLTTTGVTICCRRSVDMRGSTDHPALLATLTIGRPPR